MKLYNETFTLNYTQFHFTSCYLCAVGTNYNWFSVPFSTGEFKSVCETSSAKQRPLNQPNDPNMAGVQRDEGESCSNIYSCPQEGCVRVFKRQFALERHLPLEACT